MKLLQVQALLLLLLRPPLLRPAAARQRCLERRCCLPRLLQEGLQTLKAIQATQGC